jgi:ribonucleoside-diphosphate reductase alpha chain
MAVAVSSGPLSPWAETIFNTKYAYDENENWEQCAWRGTLNVLGTLGYKPGDLEFDKVYELIRDRKFIPGGRYLYSAGRELHNVNNCFLLKAEDSREGWADLLKKAAMILQMGGGVGVEYSDIREEGAPIRKTGGVASGPLPLMTMVNEIGRGVMQGGSRRSALIALLDWDHPDAMNFIHMKDWPEEVVALKEKDFNFPAKMDMTNISINLDDKFFAAYEDEDHPKHNLARKIYEEAVANMVSTGEPGFSINTGGHREETLRNPCSEIVSDTDSDVCCLGSINLSRFDDINDFESAVKYSTLFLLAGTVYSDTPYNKIGDVRDKNRRLGLGLMGIHEWLLKRGLKYEPNGWLEGWLKRYETSTNWSAFWAKKHGLATPVASRAIAPTGTISIIGETTGGIEPIFCVAYKRRYLNGSWKEQYIVDPTAQALIEKGVNPGDIEDAYSLSYNVERRIAFQAWIQQFVDNAVSSTINLPYAVEDEREQADFAYTLYKYLPLLRGITCYPDGARGGQPLTPISYEEAIEKEGMIFESNEENCKGGVCGV